MDFYHYRLVVFTHCGYTTVFKNFIKDLLLSAFPSQSKLLRRIGKQSDDLTLGLRVFLNTKYANLRSVIDKHKDKHV